MPLWGIHSFGALALKEAPLVTDPDLAPKSTLEGCG